MYILSRVPFQLMKDEIVSLYLHYGLLEVVSVILYGWGRPAPISAASLAAGWPGDSSLPRLSVWKIQSQSDGNNQVGVVVARLYIMLWTGTGTIWNNHLRKLCWDAEKYWQKGQTGLRDGPRFTQYSFTFLTNLSSNKHFLVPDNIERHLL